MPLFVISFEYLAKPLMTFWHTRYFYRNLRLAPKFAIFLQSLFVQDAHFGRLV